MNQVFHAIAKGLHGRTEALLLFGVIVGMIGLAAAQVPPWLAVGGPIGIYILYLFRMLKAEDHEIRVKELEISKLEQTQGQRVREIADRKRTTSKSKGGPKAQKVVE